MSKDNIIKNRADRRPRNRAWFYLFLTHPENRQKRQIFRGSLDLALAISRAFTAHGIETELDVEPIQEEMGI